MMAELGSESLPQHKSLSQHNRGVTLRVVSPWFDAPCRTFF
jgi:hypothetical protein